LIRKIYSLLLILISFSVFAQSSDDQFNEYLQKYHEHLQQKVVRNSIYSLAKSDPARYKSIVTQDMHKAQNSAKKIMAAMDALLARKNIVKKGSDAILHISATKKRRLSGIFAGMYKNLKLLNKLSDKYERDFWDALFKDKKLYFEAYLLGNIAKTMEFNGLIFLCKNVTSNDARIYFNSGYGNLYPKHAYDKLVIALADKYRVGRFNYFFRNQDDYLIKFYKNNWNVVDTEKWMLDYYKFNAPIIEKYLDAVRHSQSAMSALNGDDDDDFNIYIPSSDPDITEALSHACPHNTLLDALYPIQSKIFTWYGDLKLKRKGKGLIKEAQLEKMIKDLKPGDILLERQNWSMSNLFITGFWPHGIVYVGTQNDLKSYIDSDTAVKKYYNKIGFSGLTDFLAKTYPQKWNKYNSLKENKKIRVIEAISDGVIFNSIEESCRADFIAAMRPSKISILDKALAIADAFSYQGRPYDFNFDFVSEDALVCTELVVKSYGSDTLKHGIDFEYTTEMGKQVVKANTICHQFDQEFNTNRKQLNFVYFLKGLEKQNKAIVDTCDKFRRSWRWKAGLVATVE